MFYEKLENGNLKCGLCPHGCRLKSDQLGICMARKNIGGILYSLNYGRVTSLALDPIEKKPLKSFYPGSNIFSIGTFGCNFKCSFCQNHEISQKEARAEVFSADELVEAARKLRVEGNIGIAYTYNEPSVWYEFVYEVAEMAHDKNLKNVLVTNGYICEEPLLKLLPYIDAMNIDLKSFQHEFYQKVCAGELEEVKRTIELAATRCHVEVTTLLIPNHNDTKEEIGALSEWLSQISPEIVLHLTRYYPMYQMHEAEMSREKTIALSQVAKKYLKSVFCGNM